MKLLRKLFFEQKMTWKKVLIFALVTAVLSAAALRIPGVRDTSLANIGISFECWILFALIIIMNCEKPLEAALKTFVFFLVSQPLIYLLQIPFLPDGWGNFIRNYPRWAVWTVLTFPGAFLAWYVKKDKWYSALILSVATAFLAYECIYFLRDCISNFPHELIAALFCAVLAVLLIVVLLKNRRNRLIAGAITLLVAFIAAFLMLFFNNAPMNSTEFGEVLDDTHTWEVVSQGDSVGTAYVEQDGHTVSVFATSYGEQEITVQNEAGETLILVLTYDKSGTLDLNQK